MVGFGYDIHKLSAGNSLIIGGVKIDSDFKTIAHSDGDVLLHALCDALLGAAGLGDIGEHFPDTDIQYKDVNSKIFVLEVMKLIKAQALSLVNIDATIILEKPKLKDYKKSIEKNISTICNIPIERVNIKAKTSEKLGFVGKSEAIEAYCICEIQFSK